MRATNPTTIDGKVFDQLSINLAISYRATGDDQGDASVAMRIIPTCVDGQTGEVITADEAAIGISVASLDGIDQDAAAAVNAVKTAIQAYLTAKGI